MKYEVEVPLWVYDQITEIAAYISGELSAPQAAQDVLNDLEAAIMSLDMYPERIPFSRDKFLKSCGLRCMVVRKYLIYFQIDEAARRVILHAVIYGKRDQAAQAKGIPWE